MDTFRIFSGMVFAISVFLLVDAWVRDHQKAPPVPPAATSKQNEIAPPVPSSSLGQTPRTSAGNAAPARPADAKLASGERIRVTTDLLIAEIDTVGGDLRRLELAKYRDTFDQQKNFVLLEENADHTYVAQTGLIGESLPNHNSLFKAERNAYELGSADAVTVKLEAVGGNGIKAVKTYTFRRGSYVVDVSFDTSNKGGAAIEPFAYFQLVRDTVPPLGDSKMVPTFNGAEVYTDKDKVHQASFENIVKGKATYPKKATDGWVAVVQHYFLGAWLPKAGVEREYFLQSVPNSTLFAAGVIIPVGRVEPGQSAATSVQLFVGPQEQALLKTLAPGLEYTVDYGYFRVLAVPLFWVLNEIHKLVKNWGVAIIILTVIIKLIFYPLSAASYKSMAKMKILAPKLQRLKERFGDDRQRMHQAMVEMYKTEKINPLGGCLPIVVQIPVFISLYWVLLLSVEMRQAPFALWIHDLSRPDPYYILPIIMGATMFLQTWLNPTPPDPMQAKLMKIMPVAFSVFFFFFPSGLVLYWVVNNILSIAQQWRITHVLERAKTAHGET